jgi:hypothetical protein
MGVLLHCEDKNIFQAGALGLAELERFPESGNSGHMKPSTIVPQNAVMTERQ